MRVAMIGKGWFPDELGGLDRYFTSLFRALDALPGAAPTALVIGPASGTPDAVRAVSAHHAPLVRRLSSVVRAAASLEADVVDAHFALYAFLPLLVTKLRRAPLLVHFQGPWADEGAARGATAWTKRRLERAVYRRAECCIVLTNAFKRVLVERYGVAPWKVVVEPPGVDLERFSPGDRAAARAAFDIDAAAFVVSCVRRLVPRMGIDTLLEAWAQLAPRLDGSAQLVVAGDGPLRAELEVRARELGVADSVRFLGRVRDEQLADVYRAADVNVVPSVAHEGFGLVVLEAAACATPSVVTRVGGLPEAVCGLDASLAVEPASPAALANRLLGPLPERAAARAFAERFGWAQVADRDLERLRAAAGGPARGKLRVVYLDHVARMSGGEIALLRLLPYLLNVEPHVILAEDGPLADALVEQGISVEVLPMPKRARATRKDDVRPGRMKLAALLGSAVYTLRIARRLRALRPDLVHTNSLKSGVYGSIAGRLAGIPVVWHVRDRIAPDYLPSPAVRMVHVLIRRLSGAVIANSQATLATLERPAHSAVVYSVVPEVIEIADRIERSGTNGPTVFGMVGRLAPWKGQDIFLDAFARAFPEGRQRAVVVGAAMFGDDERRYADALEERVRTLGLADRVEFRGFRSDVREELGRIDVLVHASRTPEPFGQVIVEGMAAGLPVLASAGGGPLELITDEVDGLLCPPGDVERLAGMLVRLDADPDLRQRLGEAARSRALDFLPEPIAERVEALYASTLRRPSNG